MADTPLPLSKDAELKRKLVEAKFSATYHLAYLLSRKWRVIGVDCLLKPRDITQFLKRLKHGNRRSR